MKFILSCWDVLLVTQEPLTFNNPCLKMVTQKRHWYLEYRRARRGVLGGEVVYIYMCMYCKRVCVYIYTHCTYVSMHAKLHPYMCTYIVSHSDQEAE